MLMLAGQIQVERASEEQTAVCFRMEDLSSRYFFFRLEKDIQTLLKFT